MQEGSEENPAQTNRRSWDHAEAEECAAKQHVHDEHDPEHREGSAQDGDVSAEGACDSCHRHALSIISAPRIFLVQLGSRTDIYRNSAPLALVESQHAQQASRRMSNENRDPDVDRLQSSRPLNHEADPEGNDDL